MSVVYLLARVNVHFSPTHSPSSHTHAILSCSSNDGQIPCVLPFVCWPSTSAHIKHTSGHASVCKQATRVVYVCAIFRPASRCGGNHQRTRGAEMMKRSRSARRIVRQCRESGKLRRRRRRQQVWPYDVDVSHACGCWNT